MTTASARIALALTLVGAPVLPALASPSDPPTTKTTSQTAPPADPGTGVAAEPSTTAADDDAQADDPDRDVNRAQPDFTLVGLPTTLRLPRHGSAFRITHRFGRPLGQGDFNDLVQDFFGFDSGAVIGFEYRFGLFKGTQLAVHRTNDRTIQFLAQYEVKGQSTGFPLSVDVFGSAEGTNNFRDSYSPGVGAIVSHEFTDRAAVYVEPFWVNNTNPLPSELVDDNNAFLVGLGARVRVSPTVYGVVEFTPRVAGNKPGDHQVSLGVEKRAGGHLFQLNFSNGFGTTFAQMARGGGSDWHIGFNISRKFY